MIQEISIAQLDPRQVKQLQAADAAANSNISYSLEIYSSILKAIAGLLGVTQKT